MTSEQDPSSASLNPRAQRSPVVRQRDYLASIALGSAVVGGVLFGAGLATSYLASSQNADGYEKLDSNGEGEVDLSSLDGAFKAQQWATSLEALGAISFAVSAAASAGRPSQRGQGSPPTFEIG